jgi:hypothetical protein
LASIEERAAKHSPQRNKRKKVNSKESRDAWEQTSREQQESLDICDEKVALAEQAYELVDGHIRRLDDTLRKVREGPHLSP